jgi:hypothetical protein
MSEYLAMRLGTNSCETFRECGCAGGNQVAGFDLRSAFQKPLVSRSITYLRHARAESIEIISTQDSYLQMAEFY